MTEFEPLLHTSADETELIVLRSLATAKAPPAALARTAVALGLGAGAVAATGPAAAAGAASGVTGSSSIWLAALKALAIGVTSGLAVTAGVQHVASDTEPEVAAFVPPAPVADRRTSTALPQRSPEEPAAQGEVAVQEPASGPDLAARATVTPANTGRAATTAVAAPPAATATGHAAFAPLKQVERDTQPRAAAAPIAPPTSALTPSAPRPSASVSIADEVRAVDRARAALARGRAGEALRELDRYQARWPRGVFFNEVAVLRVEARLKLGDRTRATREARALIDANPGSRYAARLRALLDSM
jgi:hypothetical protein